jgi:putative SOS response-associated peptidase YedK
MCGRVRLANDYSEIKIRLKFAPDAPAPNYEVDYNKPPTMPMLVAIRSVDGQRIPRMMKWGLIPYWAKDDKLAYSTFNARSEEFTTKPAFKDAWRRGQRCLVVTNGFYEWKKLDPKGKLKQAYAVGMADDGEMVMAGLWSTWRNPANGEEIQSCTVLTCAPNDAMAEIHNRMPVILDESDWPKWLGEEPATEQELLALLRPSPDERLKTWRVDNKVGNVRNTGRELILPPEKDDYRKVSELGTHLDLMLNLDEPEQRALWEVAADRALREAATGQSHAPAHTQSPYHRLRHVTLPTSANPIRTVQEVIPIAQGAFRVLINRDDDCLDVL